MDWKPITELRSVTCHMGSHSVASHPTQVNAPRLNPSHAGRYSIYLPRRDGRLSWPWWLVIYRDGLRVRSCKHSSRTWRLERVLRLFVTLFASNYCQTLRQQL